MVDSPVRAQAPDGQSPIQTETRVKILQATRLLVEKQGLENTNMMEVAKAAGIGRATLYRYYTTREYLIGDLTLEWSLQFARQLAARKIRGNTVGQRLEIILRHILEEASKHTYLSQAALSSLITGNERAVSIQKEVETLLPDLLLPIIEAIGMDDLKMVTDSIHRLMLGTLFIVSSDRDDVNTSLKTLTFTLQKLIGKKVWDKKIS